MKLKKIGWILPLLFVMTSCTKEDDTEAEVAKADITFTVTHEVDGSALVFNQLLYTNEAGNKYEVSRLEYYLSDFKFKKANGSWYTPTFEPVLINGSVSDQTFLLKNVPMDSYYGFSFMIGLNEEWNKTGSLENNLDNYNMAWPDVIGGGYHFMKFEGNYLDLTDEVRGFTVHLGNNGMQSVNEFDGLDFTVSDFEKNNFLLTMNLNEWFESPNLFDFNKDGNYTMAIDTLMKKVSDNGRNCIKIEMQ